MLSTILHSYVQYGDKFLLWNMTFPSGKIYQVNMVFPLCLFAVDIKGSHKLVGIFNSYSQVERSCISCDCECDNLDNFKVQYNAIIQKTNIILYRIFIGPIRNVLLSIKIAKLQSSNN